MKRSRGIQWHAALFLCGVLRLSSAGQVCWRLQTTHQCECEHQRVWYMNPLKHACVKDYKYTWLDYSVSEQNTMTHAVPVLTCCVDTVSRSCVCWVSILKTHLKSWSSNLSPSANLFEGYRSICTIHAEVFTSMCVCLKDAVYVLNLSEL